MTNILSEATRPTDPEGSIFLPDAQALTLPQLDKMKFAVMQLRGDFRELTLEEQGQVYDEILTLEQSIRARDCELGSVALSVAV